MHSFVFDNDKTLMVEANLLAASIESHYEALRLAQLGKKCRLNGVSFELIAFNRNAVYRLHQKNGWYLKLPVSEPSSMVRCELLGAGAVHRSLSGHDEYLAPAIICVPNDLRYVLTAEIPGVYLISALYGVCLRPWKRPSLVMQGFQRLGRALARLHENTSTKRIPKSISPGSAEKLREALCKTSKRDMICDLVEKWLEDQSNDDNESLVHGNLRRENMLFHDGRVGLVDFETCGAGSRYDDLSSLCSNLALTRAAAIFPWRLVFSACSSFLRGYREIFSFDRQALRKKTLMQLSTNYLWILAGKKVTVAKIPISKRRLANMIQASIRGDWQAAFPGIDL